MVNASDIDNAFQNIFNPTAEDTPGGTDENGAPADENPEDNNENGRDDRDGEEDDGSDEEPDGGSEEQATDETRRQSREENAKYAAARRKAERQAEEVRAAAVQSAREEMQREHDEQIRAMGMTNPYTGKPIENQKDLKAYSDALAEDRRKAAYRELAEGADEDRVEELTQELVANSPEMLEAKATLERLKRLDEESQRQERLRRFDEDLTKIQKLDPSIKDAKDLFDAENAAEIEGMLKRGYSIYDAYRIANFDRLQGAAREKAERRAERNIAGKDHMRSSSQLGAGQEPVPADVMADFRRINPKATDEQIRAFYAKDQKRMKR